MNYIKTNEQIIYSYADSSTSTTVQYQNEYTNSYDYYTRGNYENVLCICTTHNCNQDLSTCAIGFSANLSRIINASSGNFVFENIRFHKTAFRVRLVFVVMMKDLQIGERILNADDNYSPVLMFFVHQKQGLTVEYLQISINKSTLEITSTHLILMRRHHESNPPKYLQAQRLHVGDSIFSINEIMHLHLSPNLELSLLIILLSLVTHNINLIGFYSH